MGVKMQGCGAGVSNCAALLFTRCHAGCAWAINIRHLKTTAAVHLRASVRNQYIQECHVKER